MKKAGCFFIKDKEQFVKFYNKRFVSLIMDSDMKCKLCSQLGKPKDVAVNFFSRKCFESFIYHLNKHVKLYDYDEVPKGQ